jgi:hypothetical protein
MTMQATWNGSQAELSALLNVITRNCTCGHPLLPGARCAAHGMLLEQRVIDGLLFAHRLVDTFVLEEFEIR